MKLNEIMLLNSRPEAGSVSAFNGRTLLLCGALLTMLSGAACSTPPPPAPPSEPQAEAPVEPEPLQHVIRYPGETLGLIAKWYTGSASNWELILKANPTLRPNRLNFGTVVMIPGDLVLKTDPLPQSAVPKVVAAPPKPEQPDSADLKFGSVEGDSPAPPQEAAPKDDFAGYPTGAPQGEIAQPTQGTPSEPSVDQLLEELANSAGSPAQGSATPGGVVAPTEQVPPPAAPVNPGDAEREQLLDELLEQ